MPFCLKRCGYCDFCSSVMSESAVAEYTAAIVRNIAAYKGRNIAADTVYLGGGTPSLLSESQMSEILAAVDDSFILDADSEITCEANPCTVDLKKLRAYRSAGVNRISFGIQSCKDNELYRLGRLHNFRQAAEAVEAAQKADIENLSCDIMLGIPEQTLATLGVSIDQITALGITHVSAYMLKIEEGTPFDCDEIRAEVAGDDELADMYLYAVKRLSERGFAQYEISNFSREGFESRHNLKYWTGEPYIGFGPSAHSYFGGRRFFVPPNIKSFISSPLQIEESEDEAPNLAEEYVMLGLRLCKGISLDRLKSYGFNTEGFLREAKLLERNGLLRVFGDRIALTAEGFLVSNGIIARLTDSLEK